ncbi:hypothetical protein NC652_004814 [Populus alba x Populus x berolinensis]|nr:hypothetical protein NC652_004814 [Populus alba x Populus x berolinensis]
MQYSWRIPRVLSSLSLQRFTFFPSDLFTNIILQFMVVIRFVAAFITIQMMNCKLSLILFIIYSDCIALSVLSAVSTGVHCDRFAEQPMLCVAFLKRSVFFEINTKEKKHTQTKPIHNFLCSFFFSLKSLAKLFFPFDDEDDACTVHIYKQELLCYVIFQFSK